MLKLLIRELSTFQIDHIQNYQLLNIHIMMQEFNTTAQITLIQLQTMLEHGPILIGETHAQPFAREAVAELIKKGVVRKLFLELPNLENSSEPASQQIAAYLGSTSIDFREQEDQNPIIIDGEKEKTTVKNRILQQLARGESVTSQDVGQERSFTLNKLIGIALEQTNPTVTIYYYDSRRGTRKTFLIKGEYKPREYSRSIPGVTGRNEDSAAIIKKYNGLEPGTIILAGMDHLDPEYNYEKKKLGHKNTLQYLLNCDHVFDLTTEQIKQVKSGKDERTEHEQ